MVVYDCNPKVVATMTWNPSQINVWRLSGLLSLAAKHCNLCRAAQRSLAAQCVLWPKSLCSSSFIWKLQATFTYLLYGKDNCCNSPAFCNLSIYCSCIIINHLKPGFPELFSLPSKVLGHHTRFSPGSLQTLIWPWGQWRDFFWWCIHDVASLDTTVTNSTLWEVLG